MLSEGSVHGLCLSLNSPVVHTDELPLGPMRAAIAFHADAAGAPSLTVALRSVDVESSSAFGYDGELDESEGVERNLAIALRFAESLGFLFDDDLVAAHGGDAAEAAASWRELLLGPEPRVDAELLLDEQVEEAPPAMIHASPDDPAPVASSTPRMLSKFRRALGREPGDEELAERAGDAPHDSGSEPCGAPVQAARAIARLLACY